MIDYFLNGLLVAIAGLSLLRVLDPARARLRLYLCFVAIVLSALPWHWLGGWLPSFTASGPDGYVNPRAAVEVAMQPVLEVSTSTVGAQGFIVVGFGGLILAGVLGFAWIASQQYALIRTWRRIGKRSPELSHAAGQMPVWLVPGENLAVATLFGAREIWIGESLALHPNVDVALAHELTHHQLRHPSYEWLLTLVRCVFWWNPVVWVFVARARKEIEIECDEVCAETFGPATYQMSLARLLTDVEAVHIGSAFGGRGSFNVERLRRISCATTMGWMRRVSASLIVCCGGSGFVFVHAETTPVSEQAHKGWNVRYENVTLSKGLEQIAELGGIDIYLDPRIDRGKTFTFEASQIRRWEPLIESIVREFDDVDWAQRGGVVLVGSRESINDDSWLSSAIVLHSHGAGLLASQIEQPDSDSDSLYIDIKFEERLAQDDYNTSQMAVLIAFDQPAAIRKGDLHITLEATRENNQLTVAIFRILPDGRMNEVGRASMEVEDGGAREFSWPKVQGVDYALWLNFKKQRA